MIARVVILVLLMGLAASALAEDIKGPAKVIDGDTLEVAGRVFHLYGIDAPELGQTCEWPNKSIPCGDIARTALMDLVVAAEVVCKPQWKAPEGGLGGLLRRRRL